MAHGCRTIYNEPNVHISTENFIAFAHKQQDDTALAYNSKQMREFLHIYLFQLKHHKKSPSIFHVLCVWWLCDWNSDIQFGLHRCDVECSMWWMLPPNGICASHCLFNNFRMPNNRQPGHTNIVKLSTTIATKFVQLLPFDTAEKLSPTKNQVANWSAKLKFEICQSTLRSKSQQPAEKASQIALLTKFQKLLLIHLNAEAARTVISVCDVCPWQVSQK